MSSGQLKDDVIFLYFLVKPWKPQQQDCASFEVRNIIVTLGSCSTISHYINIISHHLQTSHIVVGSNHINKYGLTSVCLKMADTPHSRRDNCDRRSGLISSPPTTGFAVRSVVTHRVSTQTRATQAIPRITKTALKHTRNLGSASRCCPISYHQIGESQNHWLYQWVISYINKELGTPKSSLSSSHSSELYQCAETTPGSKASVWGSHHYYKNELGVWCLMVLKSQATPKWNHDHSSSASWVFAMLLIELIELFIVINNPIYSNNKHRIQHPAFRNH